MSSPSVPARSLFLLTIWLAAAFACAATVHVEHAASSDAGATSSGTGTTSSVSGGPVVPHSWAQRFDGYDTQLREDLPQRATSIAVSPAGNIAVIGGFRGAIDFGLGPLQGDEVDLYDTFVVKLDADGNPIWNRNLKAAGLVGFILPFDLLIDFLRLRLCF
jgi:hypothetical protein